ncbi:(E3-independent) E2 ubiquitin-conjugating enzyme UBE2O-like [Argonauta hians]
MAACNIFDEDEVCMVTDKGCVYGLVLENSEYVSSDEEQNDPDQFCDCVRRGTVRVAWHPDGKETVVPECKLVLADRSLMPGDCVRRLIQGEDSQRGYVQDMTVKCCLQVLGTKKFIDNIDSRDLLPIREWSPEPGDVVLDSWVGRIDVVNVIVTLRFPDGAQCEIQDVDIFSFEDLNEKRGKHTEFVNRYYYPGQQLRGVMGDLRDVDWIQTTQLYNKHTAHMKPRMNVIAVVEDVKTKDVEVHWTCCGFKNGPNVDAPPFIVKKDDIKRMKKLDWFHHSSIQIGDKCYYTIKERDEILNSQPKSHNPPDTLNGKDSNKNLVNGYMQSCARKLAKEVHVNISESDSPSSADDQCVPEMPDVGVTSIDEVENLDEYEEVDDEDESDKASASGHSNTSSSSLRRKRSAQHGPALKTRLMKRVRGRKARQKLILPERVLKAGEKVPVEVCYTFSLVNVVWQDGSIELSIPSPELFPIHHLDELEFFPGDYVLDAKDSATSNLYGVVYSCNHAERTCLVKWMRVYDAGKSNRPEEISDKTEVSVYDIKDHPYYKYRPGYAVIRVDGADDHGDQMEAAGQVYQLDPQGYVLIKWPSSRVSCCYPQELFIVGDELSEMSSDESSDDSDDNLSDCSWVTENEEEIDPDTLEPKSPSPRPPTEQSSRCATYDERKEHLDNLIQRGNRALTLLLTLIKTNDPGYPYNVLKMFYNCQSLDMLLKMYHFVDPDINDLVLQISEEIRKRLHANSDSDSCIPLHSSNKQSTPGATKQHTFSKEANGHSKTRVTSKGSVSKDSEPPTLMEGLSQNSDGFGTPCQKTLPPTSKVEAGNSPDSNMSHYDEIMFQTQDFKNFNPECTKWNDTMKDYCLRLVKLLLDRLGRIMKEVNKKWRKRIMEATKHSPFCDNMHKDKGVQTDLDCVDEVETPPGLDWFSVSGCPNRYKATQTGMDPEPKSSTASKNAPNKLPKRPSVKTQEEVEIESTAANLVKETLDSLSSATTVEQDPAVCNIDGFQVVEGSANGHFFFSHTHLTNQRAFFMSLKRESKLLKTSLPNGILVKEYEERMDLFSVMIVGPANTPYEDGLFLFDVQLPNDYPTSPPRFHYLSFCADRLNPNLYEDGKVCVSLLGTWSGKGNEVWTQESNLLQVLVSIQGLILVCEPYYNEAGYEKQRGTQQGVENSRMYNEMAIVKVVQSMGNMACNRPTIFSQEIRDHLRVNGPKMITRLKRWLELSDKVSSLESVAANNTSTQQQQQQVPDCDNTTTTTNRLNNTAASSVLSRKELSETPEFSLLPASRGFCLSLKKQLESFQTILKNMEEKN